MLVLTRKQQEKIQIGDNITITVLRTKGKAVRLGIEAPDTVAVLRGELADTQRAAEADVSDDDATSPRTPGAGERPTPDAVWPTDKSAAGASVSMKRVPRSRVATILPEVLGEGVLGKEGPLRAMLDRRAAASQA
ncbi:MAG: carbon storage regulator [Planctomycetota bacterium]